MYRSKRYSSTLEEPVFFFFFTHIYFLASGQGRPFFPPVLAFSIVIAHIGFGNPTARPVFSHGVLLNSCSRAFRKSPSALEKKSPRIYASMHSGGFELTKLTYTRLEDNLIRHLYGGVTLCK